jgi:hypothetical protein
VPTSLSDGSQMEFLRTTTDGDLGVPVENRLFLVGS